MTINSAPMLYYEELLFIFTIKASFKSSDMLGTIEEIDVN